MVIDNLYRFYIVIIKSVPLHTEFLVHQQGLKPHGFPPNHAMSSVAPNRALRLSFITKGELIATRSHATFLGREAKAHPPGRKVRSS